MSISTIGSSSFELQMTTLESIYSHPVQIRNPKTNDENEYEFVSAIPVLTQYVKDLREMIVEYMKQNLNLASKETEKKLKSTDYQNGIKETNAFKAKIKEFEAIVKIFKKQQKDFAEVLNHTRSLKDLSHDQLAQLSQKDETMKQVNLSLNNLFKEVDDQNKKGKGLLRNDLNWLGQVIVRKGNYPGNTKYYTWSVTGAEKYQFPLPKELKKPIKEAIANWSDNAKIKSKVTQELALKLDNLAAMLKG